MRQFAPSTNLVLAVLAGLGLLGTLTLNWYAAPVTDASGTDGPIERGAFQVSQFFATHAKHQISGSDGLGNGGQTVLFGLVAVIAVLAFAVSMPAVRRQAEDLMRVAALAAPVVVIVVAATHSGTHNTPVRVHYGFLIGLAVTLLMTNAAWHGANMRERRKVAKGTVRISSS